MKDQEFQQYVIDQFTKVATKKDLKGFATKDDLVAMESRMDTKFATKDDFSRLENEISSVRINMATKSDIFEVKEMISRLDKRTDEDVKAVIKDVGNIKEILRTQGHSI